MIIPIDKTAPSNAPGTSFNGTITTTISSIFNFDLPSKLGGKQCSLNFYFPHQEELITSAFTFDGRGLFDFAQLAAPASEETCFDNAPAISTDFGAMEMSPGHNYTISNFPCPAGTTVAFVIRASGTISFDWFQDFNPSP